MKKFSLVLAMVFILISAFSAFANASGETKTEKFFDDIEKNKAVTFFEPMKNEDMGGFSYDKTSIRYSEDEKGENISEYFASAKLWFIDLEMYATQKGLFLYFPQINCHIDFSFVWEDDFNDVFVNLLYEDTELMPFPSYHEYMILKSSTVDTDIAGYGDIYTEVYTYDIEAVVNDLVSKDIIPDPTLYGISLDDNKALSEFYWNYAGDYSGFASMLLYRNEATFEFDENGMLLSADYFTGEGKDVDTVEYAFRSIGGIVPDAEDDDFIMPESSKVFKMATFIISLLIRISAE